MNELIVAFRGKQAGTKERISNALLNLSEAQGRLNLAMSKLEKKAIVLEAKNRHLEGLLKDRTIGLKIQKKAISDLHTQTKTLKTIQHNAPNYTATSTPATTSWATALGRKSRPLIASSVPQATAPGNTNSQFPSLLPLAPRPGVLFFPTGSGEKKSENTKEILKKAFDPRSLGVQITGIRNVRNGGVIVHPRSEVEAKALVKAMETSEVALRAELAGKKQPRVIIFNLPSTLTDIQLREAIYTSTKEQTGLPESAYKDIRLSHKAGPRTGRCHFVVFAPAAIWSALLAEDRLYMGWESFPLRDYVGVVKCNICHLYGHMAKGCANKTPTCSHCAISGHDREDCPNKGNPPKCVACHKHKQPSDHPTGSLECPARLHAELRERATVDYTATR
jgi:hypothetical protein